jgi:hypothetical protein
LDDEAAKEVAEQAVVEAKSSTGEVATGKASKTGKDRASVDGASEDGFNEEDATEDTDEEVALSGEDGGTGNEGAATTPAGSKVSLLLGGFVLLSVGGYAGVRVAWSWLPIRGRRLLRN